MTLIDDLANSVEAYPTTDVVLEIIELDIPGTDGTFNVGEEARFRVQVTNDGALTMTNVRVKVVAENGTQVKSQSALSQFGPEVLDAGIIDRINAHGGSGVGNLFILQAPPTRKPAGTVLATVTLEEWDADFDHLLASHSRPADTPSVTFDSKVAGD